MKKLLILISLLLIPVSAEAHEHDFLRFNIFPYTGFIAPMPVYQSPYGQAFGEVAIQQMVRPRCYLQPVYVDTLYGLQQTFERVCF